MAAGGLRGELGVADRRRAQHHAVRAGLQPALDSGQVANAAGDLHRHIDRLDDAANGCFVGWTAVAGAIEIDDVDALSALLDPVVSHRDRVV